MIDVISSQSLPWKVVLGVIGNDVHVVANRIYHIALLESGFEVANLSVGNRIEDFVQAAYKHQADAVVVSSLNGEAEYWCRSVRAKFQAHGLGNVLLYIGGNLSIGDADEDTIQKKFISFGFDRVFYRKGNPREICNLLCADLEIRSEKKEP